jgi:hypothetical protein
MGEMVVSAIRRQNFEDRKNLASQTLSWLKELARIALPELRRTLDR